MKMIPGTGTASNYGSYSHNCTAGQWPYKIPVNTLQDVQLFIDIGFVKPDAILYELIHTCGPLGGTTETLTTSSYIVGQDTNDRWYGVFKNFDQALDLSCFVIAITLTFSGQDSIWFSEEYCVENCDTLTQIKGCYGNLDNLLSYDCEGIYFGSHTGDDPIIGDETLVYEHKLLLRHVEISLASIKNTFKRGRTRNFRTEKEKVYQFYGEFVPEWYLPEIDAVFYRGEVFVGSTRYLVNETGFEKIEDCKRAWKPSATFLESCYQSFSCEADPCQVPPITPDECCTPLGVSAVVTTDCCTPQVESSSVEIE